MNTIKTGRYWELKARCNRCGKDRPVRVHPNATQEEVMHILQNRDFGQCFEHVEIGTMWDHLIIYPDDWAQLVGSVPLKEATC